MTVSSMTQILTNILTGLKCPRDHYIALFGPRLFVSREETISSGVSQKV